MVEESLSGQLLYMMGVLLAVFSMSMSTSVVVREGQSVQMNCSFDVKETGFTSVTWLRQTDQSTPVSILTALYNYQKNDARKANYHNGFSSKRFTWTIVANSIYTLQIRDVSVSDSGLYYCGMQPVDHMVYHNATYLTITDQTDAEPTEKVKEEGSLPAGRFCSGVCGTVVLVLGVLSAVLNVVLFILILTKHRGGLRQNTESSGQAHSPPAQVQDSDSMNYAALTFSGKKKKRSNFNLQTDNPHVIYAATR
ncbi:uncharacterized protein LOC121689838 [Alosa sapidissima]|uniref:uncharacterized protein LOC121689838 n=1 Tax=Alosa sapidissima TaxID=34773 RepID=UPI001C092C30|nr:uncharacterized protein LOC121689838 [Alosa sapidissima]